MSFNNSTDPSFQSIQEHALAIKQKYDKLNIQNGQKVWGTTEFCQGLMGDFGDLIKLLMAKDNLRSTKSLNLEQDITHEMCDLLWSVLVLANELNVPLAESFPKWAKELSQKIEPKLKI